MLRFFPTTCLLPAASLLLSACLLTALPAAADCVTAADLTAGVGFGRSDGHKGRVIAKDGGVFVDYAYGAPVWSDSRQTKLGIYELETTHFYEEEPGSVGGGSTDTKQSFRGKPPLPVAGQGWTGIVKAHTRQNNSSEFGGYDFDERFKVSYVFLMEKTVKLSGCSYKVIPVEASFVAEDSTYTRRWLYFPDLGFGLETRQNGADFGLTSLKPA